MTEPAFDVWPRSSETLHPFVPCSILSGAITVPTSSGVCGQCESVRSTRGLIGVSVVAVTVVTMTVLAMVALPLCWHCLGCLLSLHTPSTTTSFLRSSVPLGILSAFAFEPLSSAFGLKPLPGCELKPKLLGNRGGGDHRREVRVAASGASLKATLATPFILSIHLSWPSL